MFFPQIYDRLGVVDFHLALAEKPAADSGCLFKSHGNSDGNRGTIHPVTRH